MAKNLLSAVLGAGLAAALILWGQSRKTQDEPVDEQAVVPATVGESPYAEFDALIDAALAKPGMEGAALGLCVIDGAGEVVFDRHARTAFIPASSLKTLTTATALEVLGADYRIETKIGVTAPAVDGVVDGDIILLGGGDPMLGPRDVYSMASELRVVANGVQKVTGRVIGDGRLFAGSIFDDFWNWGDIGNYYGSGVSGLNMNHNRFDLELRQGAGGVGDLADVIDVTPEIPGVRFVNEVRLAEPHSSEAVTIHGGERTGVVFFRGTIPATGFSVRVRGAVPDPERSAAHYLAKYVDAAGEAVGASSLESVPEIAEVLVRHRSPPLLEIVRSIHYTSDNHETECIHRLLGLKEGKPPVDVIREHWAKRGLVFQGLRMEDGSGLARADFITPHDLAKLQFLAGEGEQGEIYRNSLMSREDGALSWKGGAMSSVRSYTGYADGADGEVRCFALMVNHYTDSTPVKELREAVWAALRGL